MHDYDAIVIGSGIGGLACASLLTTLAKQRVLVLERHFKPGGQTHEFKRAGKYSWDVGLHYVGEMEPGQGERHLLDTITGNTVEWTPLPDPYDVFMYPGFRFDVPFGESRFCERLQARFPSQAQALERYFADVHAAVHWMQLEMACKAMPPWMAWMNRTLHRDRSELALSTTGHYLDQHFGDPLLRAVLASQWQDYGLSPNESSFGIHSLATASFFKGAYYPVGGAQNIAKGALAVIEGGGGKCLVNREVVELLFEGERAVGVRARHRQGAHEHIEEFRAPVVVSDIGAGKTYLELIGERIDSSLRERIAGFRHGHSVVVAYLGLRHTPRKFGVEGANYWIFTSQDHDRMRAESGALLEGRPPYVFASFPSCKDPEAEHHTATLVATVDYELFASWRELGWQHRGDEYESLKQAIAQGLIELAERELPGLRDSIDYVELSTPLTMEHFTGRAYGAFYGVPATPQKFREPWCEIETPVPGLMLTGTDVACLGVVGAAMGGMLTVGKLLGVRDLGRVVAQMQPG